MVLAFFNTGFSLGGGQGHIFHLESSVVGVVGFFPAQVLVEVALFFGVGQVVLAPQDVGHSQQVVVYGHREVHHWVDPVLLTQ